MQASSNSVAASEGVGSRSQAVAVEHVLRVPDRCHRASTPICKEGAARGTIVVVGRQHDTLVFVLALCAALVVLVPGLRILLCWPDEWFSEARARKEIAALLETLEYGLVIAVPLLAMAAFTSRLPKK